MSGLSKSGQTTRGWLLLLLLQTLIRRSLIEVYVVLLLLLLNLLYEVVLGLVWKSLGLPSIEIRHQIHVGAWLLLLLIIQRLLLLLDWM